MSLRERVLLSVFLWICVIVWLSSVTKKFKYSVDLYKIKKSNIVNQEEWLNNRAVIQERLELALKRLDRNRTYSRDKLAGRVDTIARETGVKFETNSVSTKEGDIFDVHTLRILLKKANISELIEFDKRLKEESPYLGLENAQIVAYKTNPKLLNAKFVISSFELKQDEL